MASVAQGKAVMWHGPTGRSLLEVCTATLFFTVIPFEQLAFLSGFAPALFSVAYLASEK